MMMVMKNENQRRKKNSCGHENPFFCRQAGLSDGCSRISSCVKTTFTQIPIKGARDKVRWGNHRLGQNLGCRRLLDFASAHRARKRTFAALQGTALNASWSLFAAENPSLGLPSTENCAATGGRTLNTARRTRCPVSVLRAQRA